MILRSATSGDAHAVAALEGRLFGADAWTLSAVLAELSRPDRFAVVATENGEVLGYAITMRSGDVVDLQRIGVHPSHRRKGLARALLAATADEARADGADRMLLEVGSRNRIACAFYAQQGFVEIDRRRRYYRDGSDARVLEWKP